MVLSVMIIDDHEIFRKGIIQLLNQTKWCQVAAEAETIQAGLELVKKVKPDILLLDLYIDRNTKSFGYIDEIKSLSPKTKVILLTISEDEKDIFQATQHKVDGYLLKNTNFTQLEAYVQDIWKGETIISDSLGSTLFKELQTQSTTHSLSMREKEVLALVKKGRTNKAIAADLFISEFTVKIHVSNILRKMSVRKRNELQ
jgi:two-component system nitrate/nitrite response regulator NarL